MDKKKRLPSERCKPIDAGELADLRRALAYNPDTGDFIWLVRRGGPSVPGSIAGTVSSNGYLRIGYKGRRHLVHRLAWLFTHDTLPHTLDHINGNPADNRIVNLRPCTDSENHCNRKETKAASGYRGVTLIKSSGMWSAAITKDGKRHLLGNYKTAGEAVAARDIAAKRLHGEFAMLNL
jgi:hypothetical protein